MKNILEIFNEVGFEIADKIDFKGYKTIENEPELIHIVNDTMIHLLSSHDWLDLIKVASIPITCSELDKDIIHAYRYSTYGFNVFKPLTNNFIYIRNAQGKCISSGKLIKALNEYIYCDDGFEINFYYDKFLVKKSPTGLYYIDFMYLSSAVVYDAQNGYEEKSNIENDTDIPVFDEYIVKLGLKWRLLKHFNKDYNTEYNEYIQILNKIIERG